MSRDKLRAVSGFSFWQASQSWRPGHYHATIKQIKLNLKDWDPEDHSLGQKGILDPNKN